MSFLLLLAVALAAPAVNAANFNKSAAISITSIYSQYTDIKASKQDTPAVDTGLAPTWDVEMTLRLRSLFSFGAIAGQSTDGQRTGYGLGFRIDTPGFFFLGGNNVNLKAARRRYPVNTSIFGYLIQQVKKDPVTDISYRFVGSNLGLAMDIFMFNPYAYLTSQASVFTIQGNAYMSYGFGLGCQF